MNIYICILDLVTLTLFEATSTTYQCQSHVLVPPGSKHLLMNWKQNLVDGYIFDFIILPSDLDLQSTKFDTNYRGWPNVKKQDRSRRCKYIQSFDLFGVRFCVFFYQDVDFFVFSCCFQLFVKWLNTFTSPWAILFFF